MGPSPPLLTLLDLLLLGMRQGKGGGAQITVLWVANAIGSSRGAADAAVGVANAVRRSHQHDTHGVHSDHVHLNHKEGLLSSRGYVGNRVWAEARCIRARAEEAGKGGCRVIYLVLY